MHCTGRRHGYLFRERTAKNIDKSPSVVAVPKLPVATSNPASTAKTIAAIPYAVGDILLPSGWLAFERDV